MLCAMSQGLARKSTRCKPNLANVEYCPYLWDMKKQQTMPQFTIHDRLRKARESAGFTVRQFEGRGVASRNTIGN